MSQTWVEDFIQRLKDKTEEGTRRWCETVLNIGLSKDLQKQWTSAFEEQVDLLLQDMNAEALNHQQKLVKNIEDLLKRSEILCKELRIKMPLYGCQNLSLTEEQAQLVKAIKRYEEMIDERRNELTELDNQMNTLCDILGRKPKSVLTSPLPTEEYIRECQNYIILLEQEKCQRHEKYINIKKEILKLVNEIYYEATLEFEKIVLSEESDSFKLTDENMEQLDSFYTKLKNKLEGVRTEIITLQEKVKGLWEMLDEDKQKCNNFLEQHSALNFKTLEALKVEVQRCEILKKANIQVFLNKLRKELLHYWDLCHVGQEERSKFVYFVDDLYTEDLLTIHELETEKWRKFYLENSVLIKLLEKREKLWDRKLELEKPVEASDRYKNRGGQLLKEEKERNCINKQIPKLEERIKEMVTQFEKKHGKQFLYNDKNVNEIIVQSYTKNPDEKQLKLSAKKTQRDKTPTPFKSPRNNRLNLVDKGCKRNLQTPSTSSGKKFKLQNVGSGKTGLLGSRSVLSKVSCQVIKGGRSRYSLAKNTRILKSRRRSKGGLNMENINTTEASNIISYKNFQDEISNNAACRSTDHHILVQSPSESKQQAIDKLIRSPSPLAMPLWQTPKKEPGFKRTVSPF